MALLRALPDVLLSWGPLVVALASGAVGLLTEGAAWLLVSAVATAVPSTAAARQPGHGWVLALPAVLVLAAWLVRRQKRGWASILAACCLATGLGLVLL